MKKMTAIILTLAMAVTLSACENEEAPARNGGNSTVLLHKVQRYQTKLMF